MNTTTLETAIAQFSWRSAPGSWSAPWRYIRPWDIDHEGQTVELQIVLDDFAIFSNGRWVAARQVHSHRQCWDVLGAFHLGEQCGNPCAPTIARNIRKSLGTLKWDCRNLLWIWKPELVMTLRPTHTSHRANLICIWYLKISMNF